VVENLDIIINEVDAAARVYFADAERTSSLICRTSSLGMRPTSLWSIFQAGIAVWSRMAAPSESLARSPIPTELIITSRAGIELTGRVAIHP